MTDEQSQAQAALPDELTILKDRARVMGLVFSNNIGLAALKAKVAAKQEGTEEVVAEAPQANPLVGETEPAVKVMSLRDYLMKEELKLIRCRITNLDPKKKDLHGEILTVANEYIGTVRKFVPFGEATDNGYHIPKCIYTMMESRKFLDIQTKKGTVGDTPTVSVRWVREFALEILPPLTAKELERLAATQAAAGLADNTDED
jgi:hypothetical protein